MHCIERLVRTTTYGTSASRAPPAKRCIHVRKTRLLAGANTDCARHIATGQHRVKPSSVTAAAAAISRQFDCSSDRFLKRRTLPRTCLCPTKEQSSASHKLRRVKAGKRSTCLVQGELGNDCLRRLRLARIDVVLQPRMPEGPVIQGSEQRQVRC